MPRRALRGLALTASGVLAVLVPLAVVAALLPAKAGAGQPARGAPAAALGLPERSQHRVVPHPELDVRSEVVPQQLVLRFRPGTPEAQVVEIERHFSLQRVSYVPQIGTDAVKVPSGTDPRTVEDAIAKQHLALGAQPNHIFRVRDYTPNDPDLNNPLATSHDGQQSQWALAKVGAPAAWANFRGPGSVVVAVIDTGVDSTHPDLAGVMLPGYNLLDGNSDTFDDHGHGTMVSGVIGAVADNGTGIAGISFNTARVLPIKVLDQFGNGSEVDVAAGIVYAADHGAQVINLSLGGASYSQAIQDAVRYAWKQGALVVAAAGNNGDGTPQYPAADAWALGVAASDQNDAPAPFDSFGDGVALVAPGVAILSTTPTYAVQMTRSDGYHQNYDAFSGTSAATPLVSGLAALLIAHHAASPADLAAALEQSSHSLAGGWNAHSGYGRIDAAAALAGTHGSASGGAIRGQVVDASGQPLGGALVSVRGASETTGADGTYRLANLPVADSPYTVSVMSGGASFQSQPVTVVAGADTYTDVLAAAGPPVAASSVTNGGFEAGSFTGWQTGGGAPTPVLTRTQVHAGSYSALLGTATGTELAGDSWLAQTVHVQVPAGASKATLGFWTWTGSTDLGGFDWQEVQVRDASGKQVAAVFKGAGNDLAWKPMTFDLTPYSGSDVQLYFNVHSDGAGDLTWMYLDDIGVTYS